MEPICRNCQYARERPQDPIPDLRQGHVLECHRFPPTMQILPAQNGGTVTISGHPPTQAQHWCGEYGKAAHPLSLGAS